MGVTDPPLFTVPVVGYRRWKMGVVHEPALVDCECDACEFVRRSIAANDWTGGTGPVMHGFPALMPHGYLSTGKPWVPGRNDAVCSGRKSWPWPNGWAGPTPPPVHEMPLNPGDHPPARHPAPYPGCKCGLYAMHTIEALSVRGPLREDEVLGAVVGWGAMQVHADGWRAEHATPLPCVPTAPHRPAIHPPPARLPSHSRTQPYKQNVCLLAERYGVRAVELQDLSLIAEGYGQPLPEDAKPERPILPPLSFNPTATSTHLPRGALIAGQMGHGHSFLGVGISTAPPTPMFAMSTADAQRAMAQMDAELHKNQRLMDEYLKRMRVLQRNTPPWSVPWFERRLHRRVAYRLRRLYRNLVPHRRPGWADLGSLY